MKFTFRVIPDIEWDIEHDNIDIIIETENGNYAATLFTMSNIESLFKKNRETGECKSGTYFWAVDMILVKDLSIETINATIADMIDNEWLESACTKIS